MSSPIAKYRFQRVCQDGDLQIAQHFLHGNPSIDISFQNELAFRVACQHGHLDIAKWLLEMKPTIDISAEDEYAFRTACCFVHLDVAQWLQTLKPYLYEILYNDDGTYRAYNIRTKEEAAWLQKKVPLWLASDESPCKQNLFYRVPPDVARYIIQRYL